MNEPQAFKEIAERLFDLGDWEDRYRFLIGLGQSLPKLDAADKTLGNRVNGCVSQVWLVAQRDGSGDARISYRGESDALIMQGLMGVLLALYSGQPAREIAEADPMIFFDRLACVTILPRSAQMG